MRHISENNEATYVGFSVSENEVYQVIRSLEKSEHSQTDIAWKMNGKDKYPVHLRHEFHCQRFNQAIISTIQQRASIAQELKHPNVEVLYDFALNHTEFILATELLDGISLGALIQSKELPPPPISVALSMISDMCEGLKVFIFAFEKVSASLSFTPSFDSFWLCQNGKVKFRNDAWLNWLGHEQTSDFDSPESRLSPIDCRETSLVYSLGAIAYEILSGQSFSRVSSQDDLKPPSFYNADVPALLDALVLRTLLVSSRLRPSSLSELKADFSNIAQTYGLERNADTFMSWFGAQTRCIPEKRPRKARFLAPVTTLDGPSELTHIDVVGHPQIDEIDRSADFDELKTNLYSPESRAPSPALLGDDWSADDSYRDSDIHQSISSSTYSGVVSVPRRVRHESSEVYETTTPRLRSLTYALFTSVACIALFFGVRAIGKTAEEPPSSHANAPVAKRVAVPPISLESFDESMAFRKPIVKPIKSQGAKDSAEIRAEAPPSRDRGLNVAIVQSHEIKRVRGKALSFVGSQFELPEKVTLSVCIDEKGRVVDFKYLSKLPKLVKRRLRSTIQKWKFGRVDNVEKRRTICSTIKEKLWASDIIDTPLF